jgi:hypothetical protein
MKRLAVFVLALAACKGGKAETDRMDSPVVARPAVDDKQVVAKLVELAAKGPTKEQFPQADSYVAEERDDITLREDGTVIERHHRIVRLLDAQRGKDKFADVHIPFDARRQTLELARARTVTPDGKVHVASLEEITDIVPPQLADATVYSDVRERVVSFPAVDMGSVVELEYTRVTKPGPDAAMGGEHLLGAWNPIQARIVTITVPASITPKLEVVGIPLGPKQTEAAGTRTYTFTLNDTPDRHPETGSLGDAAVLPRLVYGFHPDWAHVLQPVADRFLSVAIPTPLPAVVTAEAARITAGATTEAERAQRIFKFVAHDIRSVDLPLGWAGYEPHAPEVVLANRYGDDRDKVGLLLALAAAAKLEGRPVLVRSGNIPVLAGVPSVAQFDRMIAKLVIAGRDVWLDPSDEHGQYGVAFAGQDNLVLPVVRGGNELGRRPPLEPSSSISKTALALALSPGGELSAKYSYEFTGAYARRASAELRAETGEHQTRFFQQAASNIAADAMHRAHTVGDTLSVAGPVAITHEVTVPRYAEAQAGFRVLQLPPSTLDLAVDVPSAALAKRTYPLALGTPRTLVEDLSLAVPAGWKVAATPPVLEGATDGITYRSSCEVQAQTVTCHTEVALDRIELPADKYEAFRVAIAKLRAYERRIVLLTKA